MGFKMLGLFFVIHAVILLVISYFVLFSVRKLEKEQGLKVFGYVLAALLWVVALFVFSIGIYKAAKPNKCMYGMMNKCPMRAMMKGRPMMDMPQSAPGSVAAQK